MKDLNLLSEQLLLAVKKEENFNHLINELAQVDRSELDLLQSDDHKIAFWINIYNSYYQVFVKENSQIGKTIYTLKFIKIAGKSFSLDEIEHGILRKGKNKYSLGYLPVLFKKTSSKKLEPSILDFRIHFALNCGAKSCPPIAFYDADNLQAQLDLSTASFLESETNIDLIKKTVTLSKLFLWFQKDFGGRKGIDKIMQVYLKQDIKKFKLIYSKYNWASNLDNYR